MPGRERGASLGLSSDPGRGMALQSLEHQEHEEHYEHDDSVVVV